MKGKEGKKMLFFTSGCHWFKKVEENMSEDISYKTITPLVLLGSHSPASKFLWPLIPGNGVYSEPPVLWARPASTISSCSPMWYVYPAILCLCHSSISQEYSLSSTITPCIFNIIYGQQKPQLSPKCPWLSQLILFSSCLW